MLKLYHGGPGANSLKALLPLYEKKLDFESQFISLLKFEQHEPWFVKMNPNGQVPVLQHDEKIITESTLINEYVNETFPEVPLMPDSPYGRAKTRYWTKFIDEYFCPALSFLGWHFMIQNAVKDMSEAELDAYIERIPLKEQQDKWRESAKKMWTEDQLAEWFRKVEFSITRLEEGLIGPWIMGEQFTLADVSVFSMVNGMPMAYKDMVNKEKSPKLIDWHDQMHERPSVKDLFAKSGFPRRPPE